MPSTPTPRPTALFVAAFFCCTAVPAAAQFASFPGAAITSGSPVQDQIVVTGGPNPIAALRVTLDIEHQFLTDLDISLISPAGTTVELTTDNGPSGPGEYFLTSFSSSTQPDPVFGGDVSGPITGGSDPFGGTWDPEGLSDWNTLYGQDGNGTWTLVVNDDAGGDDGILFGWCIEFSDPGASYVAFEEDGQGGGRIAGNDQAVASFSLLDLSSSGDTLTELNLSYSGSLAGSRVANARIYQDLGARGVFEPGTDVLLGTNGANFSGGSLLVDVNPDAPIAAGAELSLLVVADILTGGSSGETFSLRVQGAGDLGLSNSPSCLTGFPLQGEQSRYIVPLALSANSAFVQDFEAATPANFNLVTSGVFPRATAVGSGALDAPANFQLYTGGRALQVSNGAHPQGSVISATSGSEQVVFDYGENGNLDATCALDVYFDMSGRSTASDSLILCFKVWDGGSESSQPEDLVLISRDAGATWGAIVLSLDPGSMADNTWHYLCVNATATVASLGGYTDQMLVRIQERDNSQLFLDGLGIDDLAIITVQAGQNGSLLVEELSPGSGLTVAHQQSATGTQRDFGNVATGNSSAGRRILIENQNPGRLEILTQPTLGGTDAAEFSLTEVSSQSYPEALYFGGCIILEVAFTPSSGVLASKDAHISFMADDGGGATLFEIPLTGVEAAPVIAIEFSDGTSAYSHVDFLPSFGFHGILADNSAPQTITINNVGTATLDVLPPILIISGSEPEDFILDLSNFPTDSQGSPQTATVAVGGSLTFDVAFNPSTSGSKEVIVEMAHTASNEPDPFWLVVTGIGEVPDMSTSFTSLVGSPLGDVSAGPPAMAVQDQITVTGQNAVHSLALELVLSHTFVGDLAVTLTPPGGNPIDLVVGTGGGGNNFYHTVFTGQTDPERNPGSTAPSISSLGSGDAPFSQLVEVQDAAAWDAEIFPLGVGIAADGVWTLDVTDTANGDDGTLEQWTLHFQDALPSLQEIVVERPASFPLSDGAPAPHDLGNVTVGVATPFTFFVHNVGTGVLTVSGVSFPVTNQCSVAYTDGAFTVAPGITESFSIDVTPAGPGGFDFEMDIANDDSDENPYDINVCGTGVGGTGPSIIVQRNSASVADGSTDGQGTQALATPVTLNYVISNLAGAAQLDVSGVVVQSLSNVSATVTSGAGAQSISGGASNGAFTIEYTVSALGAFSFEFVISNNDANHTSFTVTVSGTGAGAAPQISVQRGGGAVADGSTDGQSSQAVGTPVTLSYTIDNTAGTAPLDVTSTAVQNASNTSAAVTAGAGAQSIAAGASTGAFTIEYTVSAAGAFSFQFVVSNNDTSHPSYTVTVSGTGTNPAPEIDIQRSGVGSIADGSSDGQGNRVVGVAVNLDYTIDNSAGTAQLDVSSTAVQNQSNVTATVTAGSAAQSIAAGASSGAFSIQYSVNAPGAFSFELLVANNDADEGSYTIVVTGTGVPVASGPEINVRRAGNDILDGSVDPVPNVHAGSGAVLDYSIENLGSADLTIGTVTFANLSNVSTPILTVQPGSPVGVSGQSPMLLEFEVLHVGTYAFDIVISNNDADEGSYTIRVAGSSPPIISLQGPNRFEQRVGAPITAFWTVTNVGAGVLVISAFDIDLLEFSLSGTAVPLSLSAGETHTFKITFVPSAVSSFFASLQLTSNTHSFSSMAGQADLHGEGRRPGSPRVFSSSDCTVSMARAQPPFALALLCLAGLACLLRRRRLAQ